MWPASTRRTSHWTSALFTLISQVIAKLGLAGVFLLMLVENLIPAIPSELILPLAGYEAALGAFDPWLAALVGAAASVIGGVVWYAVGRWLGLSRLRALAGWGGRWMAITPDEIDRAGAWFARWGPAAVCLGRALPGVRGVVCIPAGISRMPFWSFLLWSSIGASLWSVVLVFSGTLLRSHYLLLERWFNPVTDAFFAFCLAFYLWRVARPIRRPDWRPPA